MLCAPARPAIAHANAGQRATGRHRAEQSSTADHPATGSPVDTNLAESDQQPLKVSGRRPHVQVRMLPRLLPQQLVDAPATADAHIHLVITETRQHGHRPQPA
jgi:hypothetical protein